MSQSCPLPPSLLSLPAVQMLCVCVCVQTLCVQGSILCLATTNTKAAAAEDHWDQQISLSKVEKINGLNVEENEMPGCFFLSRC